MKSSIPITSAHHTVAGAVTLSEILQQPALWPTTLDRVEHARRTWPLIGEQYTIVTGAGTSAYAASAIAHASTRMTATPTTDLLTATRSDIERAVPEFAKNGLLLSMARSGNSPESVAVIEHLGLLFPGLHNRCITCNAEGRLASMDSMQAIVLDPRTNDRGLAMTSSFSNLTLAGLALRHAEQLARTLPESCRRARQILPQLQEAAEELAKSPISRVLILASSALRPFASEAALKILEMTAGRIVASTESYLGLRHGPMSFLRGDSLVLCVASSDPLTRRYEEDLIGELRRKKLGQIVAIAPEDFAPKSVERYIPPIAPELPDSLRTPFEIVFPQLFAYSASLGAGLNPDEPSPDGVISRVVHSFRIHKDDR